MSLRATDTRYELRDDAAYVVHNYHQAVPFSSFIPGIAGLWGIPLWCYYVNRGQAVACFGTQDKDHAIMEFQSANLHHRRVATEGFRTFLKVTRDGQTTFYEPFRTSNPAFAVSNALHVLPHGLLLREHNETLGLTVTVEYFTMPNEPYAALARTVRLENHGSAATVEVIDGFPKIVPYGMQAVLLQKLPFVSESYLKIDNLDGRVPFVALESIPSDTSETNFVTAGNFFFGFIEGHRTPLRAIVDPTAVFGEYHDLIEPYAFRADDFAYPDWQSQHCMTPSAFVHGHVALPAGETATLRFLAGYARNLTQAQVLPDTVMAPGYLEGKQAEAIAEVRKVKDLCLIHSGCRELDLYTSSTYLDNSLRGGVPITLQVQDKQFVFHVYSRKHGDLERDYNWFQLAPTYFSQGNGNYRDVNQNRRNDVWINPDVAAENIRWFVNLIQPDGFNPLVCKGSAFRVLDSEAAHTLVARAATAEDAQTLSALLARAFSPGELFTLIEDRGIALSIPREAFLAELLSYCEKLEEAEHGEGYWTDHWFYNLDLLESFLGIYPDRLREVLIDDQTYTYWDTDITVRPRDEKYVLYGERGVRHVQSLGRDAAKGNMIAARVTMPHKVRTQHGAGQVYTCNLLGKLVCLLVNKAASLSPSGVGVEMDGGRPGWYDSINGIPSLFGASTSETLQMLRAIRLLREWTAALGLTEDFAQPLPAEVAHFFDVVATALRNYLASDDEARDFTYWDTTNAAKEAYRAEVNLGFDGAEETRTLAAIGAFLDALEARIHASLPKAIDPQTGLLATYITHEATEYALLTDGSGRERRNAQGRPCVRVTRFRQHNFPLFLEAPTHALFLEQDVQAAAQLRAAVRGSALYDEKLGMYLTNASIKGESPELGRIHAWPPGWFENENVFTHLEHKFLLSELRAGLFDEFFADMRQCFLPFQPMEVFGRNPLENVSFISSSRHPRPYCHGRGFQPRSSGTTAEVLSMILWMSFGRTPFRYADGHLTLAFAPTLADWLFTAEEAVREIQRWDGTRDTFTLPAASYSSLFLGHTLVTYVNPRRRSTYGNDAASIASYALIYDDGRQVVVDGDTLPEAQALAVRARKVRQIIATMA